MTRSGFHGEYRWVTSNERIETLIDQVVHFHRGKRLGIACFDSGPLHLTDEEKSQGWSVQGSVAISPAIDEELAIPHAQYDEWYLLDSPQFGYGQIELFVNFVGFTLASPEDIYATFDTTRERKGWDWLIPLQVRFWNQIERIQAESYVAMGDTDVVVSRNHDFMRALTAESTGSSPQRGARSVARGETPGTWLENNVALKGRPVPPAPLGRDQPE